MCCNYIIFASVEVRAVGAGELTVLGVGWGTGARYLFYLLLTGVTVLIIRGIDCGDGSSSKPTNPTTTSPANIQVFQDLFQI